MQAGFGPAHMSFQAWTALLLRAEPACMSSTRYAWGLAPCWSACWRCMQGSSTHVSAVQASTCMRAGPNDVCCSQTNGPAGTAQQSNKNMTCLCACMRSTLCACTLQHLGMCGSVVAFLSWLLTPVVLVCTLNVIADLCGGVQA
jgi:hypothetical protein